MACAAEILPARIEAARRTRSSHPRSIALTDTRRTVTPSKLSGTGQPLGHEQLALAQIPQTRAQVEAQQLDDRHGHVRDAVGIHGQQRDADAVFGAVVQLDTLDGHAGLSFVQHDGLVVEQAPAVANVGVHAGSIGAPPRIHPGCPQVSAGIHGHHVGQALGAVTPQRRDRHGVVVLRNSFVGPGQPAARLHGPLRRGDVRRVDAGDHRAHALGVDVGAVGKEGAIDRQQFVAR